MSPRVKKVKPEIPFRRKVWANLVWVMALHLLIAVAATAAFIDNIAANEIQRGISLRNFQFTRQAASEIDYVITSARGSLARLSAFLALSRLDPQTLEVLLRNQVIGSVEFARVAVLDRKGVVVADSSSAPDTVEEIGSENLRRAAGGEAFVSAFRSKTQGPPLIVMAEPLRGGAGVTAVAELQLAKIWSIIDGITTDTSTAFLKTKEGILLAHSDKSLVFEGSAPPASAQSSLRVDSVVESADWTVVIDQQGFQAFLPLSTLLRWSLILVVMILAGVTSLAFFSVGVISRPLEALLRGIVMIGSGNTDYRIPVGSRDEFGILSRSFNEMVENLNERALALEDSERRYRIVTESVNDIIFSLDVHGRLFFINGRVEKILGFRPHEVLGRLFLDFVAKEEIERQGEGFLRGISDRTASFPPSEITFISKSGEEVVLEVEAVPIYEPTGEVRIHGVARDVTERKKLEEKLRRTEKLSALGEIVSRAAHELHNAVSGITSSTELLKSQGTDDIAKNLDMVVSEAGRAQRIVRGLLDFSRDETISVGSCGLNEAVEDALELCRVELEKGGVEVVTKLGENLPEVLANAEQLRQVFINLISNAIHAMSGSHVASLTIATSVEGGIVSATVSDTGSGIPQTHLAKIFDPFFTTKGKSGMGLGLSISLGIIQSFGGDVRVWSGEGRGSSFSIKLPAIALEAVGRPRVEIPEKLDLKSRKILVVEDEDPIREFVSSFLASYGGEVDSASNGQEAVSYLLDSTPPDLVISDFRMPDMDGRGLYEWISLNKPALLCRLIYITGDGLNPETRAFLRKSGIPYLLKPVSSTALIRSIWPILNAP